MTAAISGQLTRAEWKARGLEAGFGVIFGSPMPSGRRLRIAVAEGRILGDRDETARWRGHPWIVEEPAALTDAERTRLYAAVLQLVPTAAELELELVLGADGPVLIAAELGRRSTWRAVDGSVTIQARVCAAGAYRGPLTAVVLPAGARCGLLPGQPLACRAGDELAVLTVTGRDRAAALAALRTQVAELRLGGPITDAARLLAALPRLAKGLSSARDLDDLAPAPCAFEVVHPGLLTTVQDWPGRQGHWDVGVPPSGPFDDRSFRLANRLVGNDEGASGLEFTLVGPQLRFHVAAIVCLGGAPRSATLDGIALPLWTPVVVSAGALLVCGPPGESGCRGYLAIRGGLAVPTYLGSQATFDLGNFGGHAGRGLAVGDLVPLARAVGPEELPSCRPPLAKPLRPVCTRAWQIGVLEGPHAAPEFFTPEDMATLYGHAYEVHHNSNRTGVRLIGPKPRFARRDGGEAGLHPSNIHDNAYAIGAIDFTGDMPILLGPDGPSCGGFVCPAVVVADERWKLGQLRPGDTVRLVRRDPAAQAILATQDDWVLRRAGDEYLLVEVGPAELDLGLRLRIHLLWQRLRERREPGIIDLTPGIRSLQLHLDRTHLDIDAAVALVRGVLAELGDIAAVRVPRRTVWLPLSWDDPQTRKAIDIYSRSVNPNAPWCPSNIEFIRRINGLDSIADVKRIVYEAEYLVLGLGDVYLGAPVATPLDPRHRLVTTKYNPARTWTPQNAVGIGGAYMCIYGMEGPGGYQFVGRTVPIWDTWGTDPCLLHFFDVIRFYEVGHDELLRLRETPYRPRIEEGVFDWGTYQVFLRHQAASIAAFRTTQRAAFAAERQRWEGASS